MEPGSDHGGIGAGGTGAVVAPDRPVHAPSGDRGSACPGAQPAATDWAQIVGLYDMLMRANPSPVVELNRAVAVAMRDGPIGGAGAHRRHPRARGSGELSSRACGAGGSLPAIGANSGSPSLLRTGPRPHSAGAGAAISRTTAGRAAGLRRPAGLHIEANIDRLPSARELLRSRRIGEARTQNVT